MKFLSFTFLILFTLNINGQDGRFNFGARNSGLAGSSITIGDQYSLFNNIGGLGRVENHSIFGGYQNRFGIRELQAVSVGVIYRLDFAVAGLGFYKFGDDLFSQQRIHFGIGNKFQLVSLGLGFDLIQYNISTIGTRRVLAIQFGGIAEITPQLIFGAHIFNLNQVDLIEQPNEKVPTIMKAGISYRPTNEVMINIEVEKDLDFNEIIKAGLEYQLIKKVFVRTGIATNPRLNSFGIGFHPHKIQLDYSFSHTSKIGSGHELSVSYPF